MYGRLAFPVVGPTVWNSMGSYLRSRPEYCQLWSPTEDASAFIVLSVHQRHCAIICYISWHWPILDFLWHFDRSARFSVAAVEPTWCWSVTLWYIHEHFAVSTNTGFRKSSVSVLAFPSSSVDVKLTSVTCTMILFFLHLTRDHSSGVCIGLLLVAQWLWHFTQ